MSRSTGNGREYRPWPVRTDGALEHGRSPGVQGSADLGVFVGTRCGARPCAAWCVSCLRLLGFNVLWPNGMPITGGDAESAPRFYMIPLRRPRPVHRRVGRRSRDNLVVIGATTSYQWQTNSIIFPPSFRRTSCTSKYGSPIPRRFRFLQTSPRFRQNGERRHHTCDRCIDPNRARHPSCFAWSFRTGCSDIRPTCGIAQTICKMTYDLRRNKFALEAKTLRSLVCPTLAVSRRAMYGTCMPPRCHWRGRLQCFVRRRFGEWLRPRACASWFPVRV